VASSATIGRPRLSADVREPIATMPHDNPARGAERIRVEHLKPAITARNR
jgi:hypothetical protein